MQYSGTPLQRTVMGLGNLFVITEVRCNESPVTTNLWENDNSVRYIRVLFLVNFVKFGGMHIEKSSEYRRFSVPY